MRTEKCPVNAWQHAESPSCARHYKWYGKERVSNTGIFFLTMRTTKWTSFLKLCFITWEVRPSQPKPAKAPQLFYTELAKAMAHMHPTEQPFPHFFFPHWFWHTCNVHGKIKLASNAIQVKLIEPHHNICCVPFYVVFLSIYLLKT